MHALRRGFDGRLELLRGALHLLLQLAQFVQFHFAADVGFHVTDIPLQAAEQQAHRARRLRQPLGADDDQRHDADDHDFGEANVKHAPEYFLK